MNRNDFERLLDQLADDRRDVRGNRQADQKANVAQLAKRVNDLERTVLRLTRAVVQLTNPTKDDEPAA